MSPFGLFDLLKTLLPTPDQTAAQPTSPPLHKETDCAPAHTPQTAENPPVSTQAPTQTKEQPNACADFLYRHEQRAQSVRDKKKRP